MTSIKIKHFGPIVEGYIENDGFINIDFTARNDYSKRQKITEKTSPGHSTRSQKKPRGTLN